MLTAALVDVSWDACALYLDLDMADWLAVGLSNFSIQRKPECPHSAPNQLLPHPWRSPPCLRWALAAKRLRTPPRQRLCRPPPAPLPCPLQAVRVPAALLPQDLRRPWAAMVLWDLHHPWALHREPRVPPQPTALWGRARAPAPPTPPPIQKAGVRPTRVGLQAWPAACLDEPAVHACGFLLMASRVQPGEWHRCTSRSSCQRTDRCCQGRRSPWQ